MDKEKADDENLYENIKYWVKQKEALTQVPQANVYDEAAEMDADRENNLNQI
jgi:hypothetical protein